MLPFFSTTRYVGWVAHWLNHGDISMFIGLPVAGVLYYFLGQSIDVASETRIAKEEAKELEDLARQHMRPDAAH
jgi:hypothetical protein